MFTVAIIGRPNVGKSTLFNRIAGKRKALVHNEPFLTRDLNYEKVELYGKNFLLIDTGGIVFEDDDPLQNLVEEQAQTAIDSADLVLMVVDAKDGLLPIEKELANKLREARKEVFLVVNKIDDIKHRFRENEFYELGIEPIFPISAEHGNNLEELLENILLKIPKEREKLREEKEEIKIAIVGKPNVGKSSILNKLTGKERALVSNIPGTTRDPVDESIIFKDKKITFIDTAGIRKKSKTKKGAEILSVILALKSLQKCDLAFMVVDASQKPSHQDAYIAGLIDRFKKAGIILLNKWDKLKDSKTSKEMELLYSEKLAFVSYLAMLKTSALTGSGLKNIFKDVEKIYNSYKLEVSTSELNKILMKILKNHPPFTQDGKEYKIKYATQIGSSPPTFLLFTNREQNPSSNYIRFLSKSLSDALSLYGSPLVLKFRKK